MCLGGEMTGGAPAGLAYRGSGWSDKMMEEEAQAGWLEGCLGTTRVEMRVCGVGRAVVPGEE